MWTKIQHLLDVEGVEHQFHEGAHAVQIHVIPIPIRPVATAAAATASVAASVAGVE